MASIGEPYTSDKAQIGFGFEIRQTSSEEIYSWPTSGFLKKVKTLTCKNLSYNISNPKVTLKYWSKNKLFVPN